MTRDQARIILAFAASNMKPKEAGEILYMCSSNVQYHLRQIKEQMGWDPRNFYDLCYLVGIAVQRLGDTVI